MMESCPVAWQEIKGKRIPVTVSFRSLSEQEVGFEVGSYNPKYPLVIDPLLIWNTFLGSASNDDVGFALILDEYGNIYVTGYSDGNWGNPENLYKGDSDVLIAELDSSGVRQWHTFMGSYSDDEGDAIALDAYGNVHVAGTCHAAWGSPVSPYMGDYEAFVVKYIVRLPVADIKANGSDSTITIAQGDPLSVTIELAAGGLIDEDADWWILKKTDKPPPNRWFYFDLSLKSWFMGRFVTLQRALFDVSSKKVPKTSGLDPGTYTFYFAVDMLMNGTIDIGKAYYDKVKVIITP